MPAPLLTLGTAQLGAAYGLAGARGGLARGEVDSILRAALELEVRSLDSAPQYGEAEARIGRFLQREASGADLSICTKLPKLPPGLTADALDGVVTEALEASRRRLRRDTIDTYLVHAPADLRAYGRILVDALVRRRDAGWVSRLGVSIYDPADAAAVLSCPELSAIQFPFNLFDRRMKTRGCIEKLRLDGCTLFARSPLLQGLFALPPDALPRRVAAARPWLEALGELAGRRGLAVVPLALAYASSQSGADRLVLGVDSEAQLRAAVEAMRVPLAPGVVSEIDRVFAEVPARVRDPRRWAEGRP